MCVTWTESSGWYEQEGHVVCANCVRKYNGSGVDASSGDAAEDPNEPPPFMFRPVKEEQDLEWKHDVVSYLLIMVNCFAGNDDVESGCYAIMHRFAVYDTTAVASRSRKMKGVFFRIYSL